ncbi:MAG: 50S ribosomal protein L31 [Deltaproteobacteria bacterium]|nr:50S ribosomal protein L31 [Deltaproteobacteria bacterium]
MKPNTHPVYNPVTITCACGTEYKTRSGRNEDFHVDVCAACHPFFTGKQKLMDIAGRVEKFKTKYSATAEKAAASKAGKAAVKAKAEKAEKAPKAKA